MTSNPLPKADMTVIVGRTASGKTSLESYLKDRYRLTSIKSYATRPKRTPDEDNHVFITETDMNTNSDYAPKNRVAETTINGYHYFATREQFDTCDLYVIDPNGFYELLETCPNSTFNLIYLYVPATQLAKQLKYRRETTGETAEIQLNRLLSEMDQFNQFEQFIINKLPNRVQLLDHTRLFTNYYNTRTCAFIKPSPACNIVAK